MKLPTELLTHQRLEEVIVGWTEGWNRASMMSMVMAPYKNILRTLKLTRNKHKINLHMERERNNSALTASFGWNSKPRPKKTSARRLKSQMNSRGVKYKLKSLLKNRVPTSLKLYPTHRPHKPHRHSAGVELRSP
jgi:hypothetical protein